MPEQFMSPEGEVTEEVVIEALNRDLESSEAVELYNRYYNQCQADADREVAANPENPGISNRVNIKVQLRMALLYSKTKTCLEQAENDLYDVVLSASQNEATLDLAQQAKKAIEALPF